MKKNKDLKIVFIKPNEISFIRSDQKLFEESAEVEAILLSQLKGKLTYAVNLFRLFLKLTGKIFSKNTIFISWFADYHSAVIAFAARLIGKKSIILIGGMEAICYPELKKGVYRNKFRGKLVGYALKNTDLIIANHKSLIYHENHYYTPENPHIDGIKHYVKGLNTPIEIVYNGIDHSRISRDLSVEKEPDLIATVGTMTQVYDFYNKGFDLFIETARANPQYRFAMLGLKKDFVPWAEEKYKYSEIPNLTVIPSYCPTEVLNEYYNKAKVYVQCSITEGMPNTLGEAMLTECIPVGSNVNGIPDAIGETGIVIKERSVEALSKGIEQAMKLDTGSLARQRVIDNFSFEIRTKKLQEILSRFN